MYLPKEKISLIEEEKEMNALLIEEFEAIDDVDAVYHNIEGL